MNWVLSFNYNSIGQHFQTLCFWVSSLAWAQQHTSPASPFPVGLLSPVADHRPTTETRLLLTTEPCRSCKALISSLFLLDFSLLPLFWSGQTRHETWFRSPVIIACTTTPFVATSRINDFHSERWTFMLLYFLLLPLSTMFYFPCSASLWLSPYSALPDGTTTLEPRRCHHHSRCPVACWRHPLAVTAISPPPPPLIWRNNWLGRWKPNSHFFIF